MQVIELLTPAYESAWLPWAVQYFFLIGICEGAALTAAACIFRPAGSAAARLLPAAVTVLAVSALAAPVSLLADLHQPARFWHFYAHPTPWSWMSVGAYLLPALIVLALGFYVAWWFGRTVIARVLGVLMAVLALTVMIYTGTEITTVRARPLWNSAYLPITLALSGWLAALGGMLLAGRLLPGGIAALPVVLLRKLSLVACWLLVATAAGWLASGVVLESPSLRAAASLVVGFPVWRMSLAGSTLIGIALLILLQRPARTLARPAYSFAVALVMLAAPWIFRWAMFMGVQGVPKYGAGLYVYQMPLGGDGLLGMLGVLGLCVALLSAVTWVLYRFPARDASDRHGADALAGTA